MKSTLLRPIALLLTFCVGVTIPQVSQNHPSIESIPPVPLSGVESVVSSGCPRGDELIIKDMFVVISVPNDGEFYLGKRKVELSQIAGEVRKLLGNQLIDNEVIFIKSTASVRFGTLSLVADQLRMANVKCIEFVLDKKKAGR
jgi:hypothetical protein